MKILIVDDDPVFSRWLKDALEELKHTVAWSETAAEGLVKTETFRPGLVLLDINLRDFSGMELLPRLRQEFPLIPVVMVTGAGDVKTAVEAIKAGAEDFLTKPFTLEVLEKLVAKADERHRRKEEEDLRKKDRVRGADMEYLFGTAPAMQKLYLQMEAVAANPDLTVLVTGETGTGKQHVARLIHLLSPRYAKPFVEVHCASLPETLLESELFGFESGAFTDARKAKTGLMEAAEGGSLFLDEIGELTLSLQTKLLKVLEQKTLRRLGSVKETRLDLRVIAATHRDLKAEVSKGTFREDLFYRLNVVPLRVPPLRERPEDIADLASFIHGIACRQNRKKMAALDDEMLGYLRRYAWPGNVRELKNVLDRMVVLAGQGRLRPRDLPPEILVPVSTGTAGGIEEIIPIDDAEIGHIRQALEKCGWNRTLAAKKLGISRKTLFNKIKRYGLEKKGMRDEG